MDTGSTPQGRQRMREIFFSKAAEAQAAPDTIEPGEPATIVEKRIAHVAKHLVGVAMDDRDEAAVAMMNRRGRRAAVSKLRKKGLAR